MGGIGDVASARRTLLRKRRRTNPGTVDGYVRARFPYRGRASRSAPRPSVIDSCVRVASMAEPYAISGGTRDENAQLRRRMRLGQPCEECGARRDQPVDLAAVDVAVRDPVRPAVLVLVEDLSQRDSVDQVEVLAQRQVPEIVVRVRGRDRRRERATFLDARARFVEELE